jgi:hypothetical protein
VRTLTTVGLLSLGVLLLMPRGADAQRSGTFSDDSLKAVSARGPRAAAVTSELRERFANRAIAVDPSGTGVSRASGWSFIVAHEVKEEARLQVNVCDVATWNLCGKGAVDVTLAAPVDTSTHFTQLADLNGLIGKARIESGYGWRVAETGGLTGGARVTYARGRYDFRASPTLAAEKATHDEYSIKGDFGYKWFVPDQKVGLLFKIAYSREHSFEPQESRNLCIPASIGSSGTLECDDLIVGAPTVSNKNIMSVEQSASFEGNLGYRLKISRDIDSNVTGYDLPLYFLPNGDGGVGGGLRVGYRTDRKHATISVFVGVLKL